MLKTNKSLKKSVLKAFRADNNKIVKNNSSKTNKIVVNLFNKSKNNKSRSLMHIPNIKAMKKPIFFTFNAKKTFNCLKQIFIKTLILQHFNLKYYIWIKIDVSRYIINKVLSELILNFNIPLNNLNKSNFGL